MNDLRTFYRQACRPLSPLPTEIAPKLQLLPDVRAVIWDVYGTLLISGSGDVGAADPTVRQRALCDVLNQLQLPSPADPVAAARRLPDLIAAEHARTRALGLDYPEVEIIDIWRRWAEEYLPSTDLHTSTIVALARRFEVQTNPCWTMPDARSVLEKLHRANLIQGIVSNAQFYTPEILGNLLEVAVPGPLFVSELLLFSHRFGIAKPSDELFRIIADRLSQRNVAPQQTLYVGNDMRNDCLPANRAGMRTALFAGDRRSLRLREDDESASAATPDLILSRLSQLPECIVLPSPREKAK